MDSRETRGEKLEVASTDNSFKELCNRGKHRNEAKLEGNMMGEIRACLYVDANEGETK